MSVWHIVTSEYPPDVGGVSDYTRQVAEGLARMGDEVHVWCPRAAEGPPLRVCTCIPISAALVRRT